MTGSCMSRIWYVLSKFSSHLNFSHFCGRGRRSGGGWRASRHAGCSCGGCRRTCGQRFCRHLSGRCSNDLGLRRQRLRYAVTEVPPLSAPHSLLPFVLLISWRLHQMLAPQWSKWLMALISYAFSPFFRATVVRSEVEPALVALTVVRLDTELQRCPAQHWMMCTFFSSVLN